MYDCLMKFYNIIESSLWINLETKEDYLQKENF